MVGVLSRCAGVWAQIDGPLQLHTEAPVAEPATAWWVTALIVGAVVVGVGSSAAAAWIWRERRIAADPAGHAFASMARRLGVSRTERRAVRALAAERGVEPVALLVSPAAMSAAIAHSERESDLAVGSLRAGLRRLLGA